MGVRAWWRNWRDERATLRLTADDLLRKWDEGEPAHLRRTPPADVE